MKNIKEIRSINVDPADWSCFIEQCKDNDISGSAAIRKLIRAVVAAAQAEDLRMVGILDKSTMNDIELLRLKKGVMP